MTDRHTHLDQAERNKTHTQRLIRLYQAQADPTLLQWAVIALFYSAVHRIEAKLADHNRHSYTHVERVGQMQAIGVPGDVFTAYSRLQDYSEDCRYDCVVYQLPAIQNTMLPYLAKVEAWASS